MSYFIGKDITVDLAASTVLDLVDKKRDGNADYEFTPMAVIINPSAEDTVEIKTIVGTLLSNNAPVTLILECGKIHKVALGRITKSGTTTNTITILGNI